MSTAFVVEPASGIGAVRFDVADSAIADLADKYLPLTVSGVNDERGFNLVHAARMDVKELRVKVEKKRKELKADALEYGRTVDSEAKRITALLEPIETHLISQEEIVTNEKERLAKIEAEKIAARTQERIKQLTACESMMDPTQVAIMPDDQFEMILKAKQSAYAERKRLESEESARQKAESARLAAERAELDRQRSEQAASQRKIDDENKRLEDAEAARRREVELATAREESAERARVETEQRIAREKELTEARAAAEEAARIKANALRPDKAKLLSVADAVNKIEIPSVSPDARETLAGVIKILNGAERNIRKLAEEMGAST